TSIYQMELRGLIVMLAWFAALAGALLTVRRFWAGRRVVLHVAAGATLAGIWFLGRFRGDAFLAAADGILMLFLFALLAGFLAQRESGPFGRATGNLAHLVGIVWLSVLVTLVFNNFPYYFQHPSYALMLPEFAVKYLLDLADAYLLDYARPLFFQAYGPDVVAPHLWVYAVAAVEIVRPGVLLSLAARVARRKARARRPRSSGGSPTRHFSSSPTYGAGRQNGERYEPESLAFACLLSVMAAYISGRRACMRSNSHASGTRTTRLLLAAARSS